MHTQKKVPRGQIILMALVFFAVFLGVASALVTYVVTNYKSERHAIAAEQALQLAEGGIDHAVYELNQDSGYSGASVSYGEGDVVIAVTSIDANTKRVTVTGYVPNSSNPKATRTVSSEVQINSSVVSFRFGVQVGQGGVVLDNNSQVNGNLYSNGNVSGNGYITGDATVAGGTSATPDQTWSVQNTDVNLGDISSRANLAQSFRVSTTNVVNKISLNIKKVGSPSDITIKIVTNNGGSPSKTVLASGSLPASSVSSSYSFVDGSLTTSPNLTAGTTYWVIVIASVNASNYFVIGADTADGYTNGTAKSSNNWNASNPSWTALSKDLNFKIWTGGVVTSLSGVHVGGTAWAHSLSSCTIDGNALYQTISACTVGGTQSPGSADASPASFPISDAEIDEWEATAAAGGIINGNYTISGSQTLGPREINGNLTVNGTLYLSGPVWVRGNIIFGNNSRLIVSSSTGNSGAILIADSPGLESTIGTINLSNNITFTGNGNPGSYPMVLSTYSGTGVAISMSNNAASVILYAPNGTIDVSNNAGANQITAKTLHLNNNATIDYINGLQSQSFSNGPGGSWSYVPGTYSITH